MPQELLTVMTRKGQITVPAAIRLALKIKIGDKIALSLRGDGSDEVVLRPIRSVVEATYGVVPHRGKPLSIEEMREQFEQGLAEDELARRAPASKPS